MSKWLSVWQSFSPHAQKILIPSQVLGGVALLVMVWRSDWLWLWSTLLGWALISGCGIAIGFHRLFSHRAFSTSRFTARALAYLGSLGGQGSPLFWVALHRGYHHSHSDTERDYHSPVHGLWQAYMGWQFYLRPDAVSLRYAKDLASDPFIKFLHRHYNKVLWGSLALALIINWQWALYGLSLPIFLSPHQEGCINLFCHNKNLGYRNFATTDCSVNFVVFGFFSWGQAFHNNHHAHPGRYDYGVKWFELDPCRWLVPVLRRI